MRSWSASNHLSCVVDAGGGYAVMKPPTKLKNSFLGRAFQAFLEMARPARLQ